jgi:putative lipoprotein
MTRMACPPPLDTRERDLLHALNETRQWSVTGQVLELRDATGAPLATFEAVYLQ